MTDIPPSRYQVVERGRRLVVIDRQTGQPVTREQVPPDRMSKTFAPPPARRPVEASAPGKVDDVSGAAVLTTSRLYDLKAPRRIVMDERFNAVLGKAVGGWLIAAILLAVIAFLFLPWLMVLPIMLLIQPKARAAIRHWITARLDQIQAAS